MNNAITAGDKVTMFYAASAGRGIDSNKEFSLLSDWMDAIAADLKAATQPWEKDFLKKMRAECAVYLEIWAEG